MTRLLLPVLLALAPLGLSAQQLSEATLPLVPGSSPIDVPDGDDVFMTHSNDFDVTTGGVACFYTKNDTQTGTQENNYWRVFNLDDFDVQGSLEISLILHGVANTTAPNEQTFFFYTVDGDLAWENLDLLDSVSFEATPDDAGEVITLTPASPIVVEAGSVLAVQVHIPDSNDEYFALAGMNQSGQSDFTYIHSDDCNVADPTPLATLNPAWEDISWVLTIVGKDMVTSTEGGATERTVVLGGAYPNPATAQAVLPLQIDVAQHVVISIHDLLGRQVGVVVDEVMQVGSHSVQVDARSLAAGTYVVRMVAGSEAISNMIVVVP